MRNSFIKAEFILVECQKCNEYHEGEVGEITCFPDIEEAKRIIELDGWQVIADVAICDNCLEKEAAK